MNNFKTATSRMLANVATGLVLALTVSLGCSEAFAQSISTVAGTGIEGFIGDGGPATSAAIRGVTSVASDLNGNIFIADPDSYRVRRLTPGGAISTVAGNGSSTSNGNGGPALSAGINYPYGVAVDSNGNLFIAEMSGNVIRKVTTDGIISLVAGNGLFAGGQGPGADIGDGGPATSAWLGSPTGVAVDSAGNVFIADRNNKRIRKVTPAGIISTVAGSGAFDYNGDGGLAINAGLSDPRAVAVDSAGNLYIADSYAHRIRKVNPAGIISTVAGNGVAGYSGDGGLATEASLNGPFSVSVGADGTLHIADRYSHRIRMVNADGIIHTVAGNGTPGFAGDGGLATSANMNYPSSVTVRGDGQLFIADTYNYRIRSVTVGPLTAPVIGVATAGDTQARVAFTAPVYDGGSAITSYTVSSHPAGGVDVNAGSLARTHLISGLNNGTSYTFDVKATNAIGTSPSSALSNAVTPSPVPGPPTIGAAVGNGHQATVSFSPPANSGGSAITGYTVTSQPAGGVDNDEGSLALEHVVAGLANGTAYTFTVAATNAQGTGFQSDASNSVTAPIVPGPPTNIRATGIDCTVTVEYDPPAIAGNSPITEYVVTSNPAGGIEGQHDPLTLTRNFTGLTCGVTYNFIVRAVTADGLGDPGSSNSITPAAQPGAPVMGTATAGNGQAIVTFAPPAFDGGFPILGYYVVSDQWGVTDSNAGSPELTHVITGLTNGVEYKFRVYAMTEISPGVYSEESNPVVPGAVPDAPAKPTVVGGNEQATVSFIAPADNGSAITIYTVTSNPAGGIDNQAGTTELTRVISGLTNGVTYTFSVSATNSWGTGQPSPASSGVIPQPASVPGAPIIQTAYADNAQAIVNFLPPSLDGGSAITGYTVVSNPAGGIDTHAGTTELAHRVSGLANGTSYTFTVKATNVLGTGPASAASNSVVPSAVTVGYGIATIAGGWLGDGGAASLAGLNAPNDVVVDSAGNQYIADRGNHRVRKISSVGVISTFAGTGVSGFSGDGGQASQAKLHYPSSLAVDSLGNLYIADSTNNRIRKVSTSGVITTIVGDGTTGVLNNPQGVALDAARNVYISEYLGNRVRKYVPGGALTTVAGTGTAGFSGDGGSAVNAMLYSPGGLVVDSNGSVFVVDSGNSRIRVISGGVINTFAGTGYMDCENGPAPNASFDNPHDVTLDSSGNVLVLDLCGIRKISNSQVTTIAGDGTGESGFSGDGGPAINAKFNLPSGFGFDSNGNLFIADFLNQRIRKIDPAGIINTTAGVGFRGEGGAATDAALNRPKGLAYDSAGNIYVADRAANQIRKVSTSGVITTVAGNGIAGFSGDSGPAIEASLNGPFGVAVDSAGSIYIADRSNNRIRIVSPDGIINTFAGNGISGFSGDGGVATEAKLRLPSGVAVNAEGTVFIADASNQRIRKVVGSIITTVAGTGTYGFSGDGSQAVDAKFGGPSSLAVDASGNVFITDTGNKRIRKVAPNGVISTVAGNGTLGSGGDGGVATAASMCQPGDVTVNPVGAIFFTDLCNHNIRKVSAGGIISTVAGIGAPGFGGDGGSATSAAISAPYGIVSKANGDVAFADANNNRIRLLSEGSVVAQPNLSIADVTIAEGNSGTKLATFTVNLSAASSSAVTYNIATSNGSATAGSDYVAASLTGQSIAPGSTSKTFTVTINGDTAVESNETFNVNVSSVVGANVTDSAAVGTITNDDSGSTTPSLSIADVSITEGNSGTKLATFTVKLSGPSSNAVSFNIATANGTATAGTDYVAKSLTGQSIAAGSTSKTFTVTINGDTAVESNETLNVNVTSVTGATVADGSAVGTISNDDGGSTGPNLSIADLTITEGNSSTKLATFTVKLSAAASGTVTYAIATANGTATAGSDYVAKSLTGQSIAAGALSKTFTVTINGDTAVESNETLTVNLSSVVGASLADGQAVGTISNDDGGGTGTPSLSIADVTLSEGNSLSKQMTFTVKLSGAASGAVTYAIATANGTAIAGTDYTAKSLTGQSISAGTTQKTFTVAIKGDTVAEANETFKVTVSSVIGATVADGQATGTISNDDGATITVARLSTGGLYDDRDDQQGEPVVSANAYAANLLQHATALCEQTRNPTIIAVDGIENLRVLTDLAATMTDLCPQQPRYTAVLRAGASHDNLGFLVSQSEGNRVQLQSVEQLATASVSATGRTRSALHAQPPLALQLLVDAGDEKSLPLTVVLTQLATTTGTQRTAQAKDVAKLIRARTHANPDERLVLLGDFSSRANELGNLSSLVKDVLARIVEPTVDAKRNTAKSNNFHVLVSKNLLTDYPGLHVDTASNKADDNNNRAGAATPSEREPQVLVLPRH